MKVLKIVCISTLLLGSFLLHKNNRLTEVRTSYFFIEFYFKNYVFCDIRHKLQNDKLFRS